MQPAVQAASRFVARHPVAGRALYDFAHGASLAFIVRRVPIVSKFLTFLVPETLTHNTPKPVQIQLEADAITTPRLRPRFNRRTGPKPF
jgi:hypothetical protein